MYCVLYCIVYCIVCVIVCIVSLLYVYCMLCFVWNVSCCLLCHRLLCHCIIDTHVDVMLMCVNRRGNNGHVVVPLFLEELLATHLRMTAPAILLKGGRVAGEEAHVVEGIADVHQRTHLLCVYIMCSLA